MDYDIERFGEKLSDDELIRKAQDKDDKGSMLGALVELTRRKAPDRFEVYHKVLSDPAQILLAKQTVAVQLGSEQLAQNQDLLLQHLETRDPSVFSRIVGSLGKIGDEHAFKRLEKIDTPNVALSRDSLDFAKSLLAYRLRLNQNFIEPPSNSEILEIMSGIPIDIAKVEPKEMREAFKFITNDLPAIPLAAEGAIKLTWQSVELLMAFTYRFHEPESLKSIMDRNALPLVLLMKADSLDRYFLSDYFFTNPSKNHKEVVILGTNPQGHLAYSGKIRCSGETFEFELKSVDSLYLPVVELEAQYDPTVRSFNFTKAISGTKVCARKTKPLVPSKASSNLAMRDS
jgi:hypothetical protein